MSTRTRTRPAPRPVPLSAVPKDRPGPLGGTRDRNRRERVDALCSAAVALFLEAGLESTSIEDLTVRVGMAKAGFYRYFSDKEALVGFLYEPLATGLDDAMATADHALATARDRGEQNHAYLTLAMSLVALAAEHGDLVRLYLQEKRGPDAGARRPVRRLADKVEHWAVRLTDSARANGLLRAFPARLSAAAVVGAVEALLFAHLSGSPVGPPDEVAPALASLVLDGLRPHPDR